MIFFFKVNNMAMFLESTVTEQQPELTYVSTLSIMEELNDITIELSESLESFFQEEYLLLTEEADDKKEEKKQSFRDKVGSAVRNIADKIRVAIVKIKQFLLYYISKAIGSKKFVRAPQELVRFLASHSTFYLFKVFVSDDRLDEIRKELDDSKAAFEKAKSDTAMFTMPSDKFKTYLNNAKKAFEDIEAGIKSDKSLSPEATKLMQACVTFSLAVIHTITSKTKGLDKESSDKE